MNFDFSPEQKAFAEQLRRALQKASPLREARACLEGSSRYSEPIWRELSELGALGAAVPEAFGGSGLSSFELCVVAHEIGRALAPVPFVSSIGLCAQALMRFGSDAQKQRWIPGLAAGRLIGTAACAEGKGELTPERLQTELRAGQLHGRKLSVLDGLSADLAIVVAKDPAKEPVLCLVDLHAPGVVRRPVESVDPSRPLAELVFSGVAAEPLGRVGEGWEAFDDLLKRAAVLIAFEQLGGAERALEMARDYALQRHSFGRAIGGHQAIKHKLANVFTRNEVARVHAYWAAWALATDAGELTLAAASARVAATDAFAFAAQENLQVHGGIGYTWESDCQLLYRRARLYALVIGSQFAWKEKIVRALETANAA
ncbi:acyl-CoA dehydrogenase [Vineibacter terrae]|uniref:Acyl-CoA dehydrogenase n=1 Tax=Vineibacter terrae TaxID=2586908 RepID=A0A5C8PTP5_9HYPH|nr:acyl-CoA dehydrogenase family protein [Vineibacter terrae]TXL81698.1 acyl-CoA dehydrogenase [Vineibacter terrae]